MYPSSLLDEEFESESEPYRKPQPKPKPIIYSDFQKTLEQKVDFQA